MNGELFREPANYVTSAGKRLENNRARTGGPGEEGHAVTGVSAGFVVVAGKSFSGQQTGTIGADRGTVVFANEQIFFRTGAQALTAAGFIHGVLRIDDLFRQLYYRHKVSAILFLAVAQQRQRHQPVRPAEQGEEASMREGRQWTLRGAPGTGSPPDSVRSPPK